MARPKGVRNPGFEEKRANLLDLLTERAIHTDLQRASLRQFAQAAQVSEPTLRHYFGDRTGLVIAVMERIAEKGKVFIEWAATPRDTYEESLRDYLDLSLAGVEHQGFVRSHAFGLIEGVTDPELGQAYLRTLLEPSLQAIETKLKPFIDPDGSSADKLRAAALSVFAPMLVAVLHQKLLAGNEHRPLDLTSFIKGLAATTMAAYPAK